MVVKQNRKDGGGGGGGHHPPPQKTQGHLLGNSQAKDNICLQCFEVLSPSVDVCSRTSRADCTGLLNFGLVLYSDLQLQFLVSDSGHLPLQNLPYPKHPKT